MTPNGVQGETCDLLVVGAGPTGLACAIEAQKVGLRAVLVDKGCVCNSLFHYPAHMTFFTTPELLEIGGIGIKRCPAYGLCRVLFFVTFINTLCQIGRCHERV